MNEWDRIAQSIVRQARTPAHGNRMNANNSPRSQQMQHVTSTLADDNGNPLRLWIPGIDPWGVSGYYFGNRTFNDKELG